MLTLIRNSNQPANNARRVSCRLIALAIATGCCWMACATSVVAQLSPQLKTQLKTQFSPRSQTLQQPANPHHDHDHLVSDDTPATGQSSILIRDEQEQPLRPSFTARPTETTLRSADPGFTIPSSPTVSDFTDLETDRSSAQDISGSTATGTFAHPVRDEQDKFAAPEPPSLRRGTAGSTAATVRVSPADDRPSFSTPLAQNDLRSPAAFPQPDNQTTRLEPTIRPLRPQADPLTATRRYDASNPAPPAAMPTNSNPRFNPQLFSSQPAQREQSPADQSSSLTRSAQPSFTSSNAQPSAFAQQRQPIRPASPIVDQNVAATSYTAPPTGAAADANLAKMIVDRYSMDNAPSPLPGEPMSLVEMMQQPLPIQSRPPMVSQYWEAWYDWAATQNANAYKDWLATIPAASSAADKGLLDAARSAADNQVLAAEIQLGKSQAKLLRFMPMRRSNLNPLPSDLPLVERYETHYELYRSRNMLPANLQGIDQMLPRTLELIQSRAKTVQMSQAAIKQTLNAYQSRQTPLASVLEAARVWRVSEQDLLASVTSYNQAIADYAMNVTRRQTTPEQTVAMLIGVPKVKTPALPAARQNTQLGQSNNAGNRRAQQSRPGTGLPARTANSSNFGQPAGTNRADSAAFGRPASTASQPSTSRPPWMKNKTSGQSAISGNSRRPSADSRPSLGTSSTGTSNPTSRTNATRGNSLFDSQPTKRTTKPPQPTGSRLSTNSFEAGTKPATSTATPDRKPFPLPKKPTRSSNSFGFGS